jgi:coenzyme Q-binding protein COQ10
MPIFQSSRSVGYVPEDMFALVADVEHYPEFLPLCEALKVRRRNVLEDGREMLIADMTIGYKAIRETFTSRVTLDPSAMKILVEYVDGPFSHMQNRWSFLPENSGTRVEFFIDYQFKSRMLGLLMGAMFDTAFRKFSDAFVERAGVIYGTRKAPA